MVTKTRQGNHGTDLFTGESGNPFLDSNRLRNAGQYKTKPGHLKSR